MYGLRKINEDGKNTYNDFVWPLTVGAEVVAPDWNPEPECGGGLHCLPNAKGQWGLLAGEYWVVLEFDEKEMVQIDKDKCKVRKCKIVFLSENPDGLLKFFNASKFNSETAYQWALHIGNREIMIGRVTDSQHAYLWADYIGDKDVMIDRVTDPCWAYRWGFDIGNQNIMKDRMTDSFWAYLWAREIGNRKIMINRITSIADAYLWCRDIGNKKFMIKKFPKLGTMINTMFS